MSRDYRYLEEAGITLAVDVKEDRGRIAIAFCSTEDRFDPGTGKDIVNTLLDGKQNTLRAFQLQKNVVSFPYTLDKPRQHITQRLLDYLADELGERMYFRQLYFLFMAGITTQGIAAQVSQQAGDDATYYKFKKMAELLDSESLGLLDDLENEADFYQSFFNWPGSVTNIMKRLRGFASAVYAKDIILQDISKETRTKKVAPRKPVPGRERVVAATPVKPAKEEKNPVVAEN